MIYIQYLLKPSENFVDKSKIIIVREKLCESLAIDLALDQFVCAEKIKEMAFAGPCFHRVSLDGKTIRKMDEVNISFIGFPVSAGTHQLEMHYKSPGLEKGIIVSIAGLVILLCLAAGRRLLARSRRKKH